MPKRKRGALKGNQNARKHGFYSKVLDEAEQLGPTLRPESSDKSDSRKAEGSQ
jgi:hypothetical protein